METEYGRRETPTSVKQRNGGNLNLQDVVNPRIVYKQLNLTYE